jgi:hypothetical protein
MEKDPIVAEVRSAREKLFEECNEDLDALLDRFKEEKPEQRARDTKEAGRQGSKLKSRAG